MSQALIDLLKKIQNTGDNQPNTHFTYVQPRQNWTIDNQKYNEFWNNYCSLVQKSIDNNKIKLYLGEIIGSICPIISSCELKFQLGSSNRLNMPLKESVNKFILGLVSFFQKTISELIITSDNNVELYCCVMENVNDEINNNEQIFRIKLMFPYCRIDPLHQKRLIRPTVIDLLRKNNLVALFPSQPIGDWEQILDPIIYSEPFPMYYSVKSIFEAPLELTKILSVIPDNIYKEDEIDEDQFTIELENIFDTKRSSYVENRLVSPDLFTKDELSYWIPYFLSLNYWGGISHLKTDIKDNLPKLIKIKTNKKPMISHSPMHNDNDVEEECDLDLADIFLPMLNQDRVNKENYWMDVGKALFNCKDSNGENRTIRGLDLWKHFTNRADEDNSKDETDCEDSYYTFNQENPLTIKTLAFYAKMDTPGGYDEWHKNCVEEALKDAIDLTHTSVANAISKLYWLNFCCSSREHKKWYYWPQQSLMSQEGQGSFWRPMDKGAELLSIISGDFKKKIEIFRADLTRKIAESHDENYKMAGEISVKRLTLLISKLKTVSYKANLVTECMEHFLDKNFNEFDNKNPNLKPCLNGVIETCSNNAVFRPGKPEDYVTKFSSIMYPEDFDWNHRTVKNFMKWMDQCFPDEELKRYFLKMVSSFLRSRNSNKIFPIYVGEGNNSKSMIKKLFEAMFGSYCITFPTSLFTGKRTGSSAAMPELAQAQDTAIALFQETDKGDSINAGILKELTGCDTFFVRFLYDNGKKTEATFVPILLCNHPPNIPSADQAVKNRLLIVPFLSTWCLDAPSSEEEQFKSRKFPMDKNFEIKIPTLARAALWVVVQMYSDYCKEGLKKPIIVEEYTSKYWEDNDTYNVFIKTCLRPSILPNSVTQEKPLGERNSQIRMTLREVYAEFKKWYIETNPHTKIPNQTVVKQELEVKLGKIGLHGWLGIEPNVELANI